MAEISKQALKVQNNTEFPNNNGGLITPTNLRSFNVSMIDSLVDEISYNVDSGSWNQQIDALEAFTASASGLTTGSLLVTASAAGNVITFTKGNNTTFNVTVATGSIVDISNLNQATASLQTFTASAAISITNLNVSSASQQVSINNLNGATGSYATTGSNTFVGANIFTSISASSFISASEFIGNGSKITGITASISMPILDEGIPQGNAVSLNFTGSAITATVAGGVAIISVQGLDTGSFNAYTASTNSSISQLNVASASLQTNSASVNVSITNLNSTTSSFATSISNLNSNSASVNTSISALNTFTASQSTASLVTSITNLNTFSASALVSISNLNTNSASVNTSITNVNSATASLFTSVNNINSATSSLYTSASLAITTASAAGNTITFTKGDTTTFNVSVTAAALDTASLATTGSNTFIGNQTISGSLNVSGTINAYALNVTVESSSVIFSSGSNILGDSTADTQTLNGQTKVSGSLGVTGSFYNNSLSYPTTDGVAGQFITTNGTGTLAFDDVHAILEAVRYGESITIGDPLYVSGSNGNVPVVYKADASNTAKMPVIYVATSTAVVNTNTTALTLGLITGVTTTGYPAGTTIYVAEGTAGWSSSRPSGSASIVQSLGIVTKEGSGGSGRGLVLNPGPATLPNLQTGYIWAGNGANQPVAISTGSFITESETGSFATTASFNAYTASNDQRVSSLETNSASVNISIAALNTSSASQQVSIDNLNQKTGSYATTGSNVFIGNETFQDAGGNASTLVPTSGSLMLVAKSFTSASAHLSSSTSTSVNLIFKSNDTTADTIISGSNNIFSNPTAATAGFKRYIGGAQNIVISGTAIPQISGSMGFSPAMNNNTIVGAGGMIMRGPVSSSAWNISNNLINNTTAYQIGSAAATNAEQMVSGCSMTNNGGSGFIRVQAYKTPLSASFTYGTNIGAGVVDLNLHSSSVQYNGSISNGGTTINNSYFPVTSSINSTNGYVSVQSTLFIGGNNIFFSGSNSTVFTSPRQINGSIIIGSNSASLNLLSDSGSLINTAIIGASLGVTGSNSFQLAGGIPSDWGSMFVGRNNAQDNGRAESAKNVFVVGTGIASNKKTGFLIDSGSNTFIEGTLNVSGSTTMTGSLILSSSNAIELQVIGNSVFTGSVNGNVVAMSITSNTASMDLNLGNYFTLTLADTATTHISASNVQPGVSATLVITTGTNSSASLAPTMLQPSGSSYSATNGSSKKDVLSIVAVASGVPFVVSTKNMI